MKRPFRKRCASALLCGLLLLSLALTARADNSFERRPDGWYAPAKPAAAVLDYSIDYTLWLAGDTISSSAWTFDAGITGIPVSIGSPYAKATTWLSGGTAGTTYNVTNTITTAAGRTEVVVFKVYVY
jgi:hypothetical protein